MVDSRKRLSVTLQGNVQFMRWAYEIRYQESKFIIWILCFILLVCQYQIKLKNQVMTEKHCPGHMPWDRSGNRVLVQSSLGKNKPTNYQIPDESFAYGKSTFQDPEKGSDLMYGWKYHQNSVNPNIYKTKDIIKTNKEALKNLACNSKTNYNFRKTDTQFQKIKQGTKAVKINLPEDNFTYGLPLEREDPIKFVIANEYGQLDKFSRHTMYKSTVDNQSRKKKSLSCHITKNHFLVKQAAEKRRSLFDWDNRRLNNRNQWKLSKYQNVNSKVSTIRNPSQLANPQ